MEQYLVFGFFRNFQVDSIIDLIIQIELPGLENIKGYGPETALFAVLWDY